MHTEVGAMLNDVAPSAHMPSGGSIATYALSPLENLMRFVYDQYDGDGAITITGHIKGLIHREPLERALLMLQRRHPKLRARIRMNADRIPCFQVVESMPAIPLQIKDFETDELPWQAEAIESLDTKFDMETGPLCRVKVLRNAGQSFCDTIITWHHSINDAISSVRFMDELLTFYDSIANRSTTDSISSDRIETLPFVPALAPPVTSSLLDRFEMFVKLCKFVVRKRCGSWTSLPSDSEACAPYWCRTMLSAEDTMALVKRCRQEQTSMYGVLFAAALSSLASVMEGEDLCFACRCPINMKSPRHGGVSNEHLGCFVSGFDKVYTIKKPMSFWNLARYGRQDVQRFIAKQGPALALKLLKFHKISASRIPKRDTLSIDNIGVADVRGEYGGLSLEAISTIVKNRYLGTSFMVIACTVKGKLNINLGAVDVAENLHQSFKERFFSALNRVIHEKK